MRSALGLLVLLAGLAAAADVIQLSEGPSQRQRRVVRQACHETCDFAIQICADMPVRSVRVLPDRAGIAPSVDARPAGCGEPMTITLRQRSPDVPMRLALRVRAVHDEPGRLARSRLTLRCLPNPENHGCPATTTTTTTTTTLPPAACAPADVQCCSGGQLRSLFGASGVELRRDDAGIVRTAVCDGSGSTVAAAACDGPAMACCLRDGCPWFAVHGGNGASLYESCRDGGGTLVRGPCDAEPIHPLRPCLVTGCSGQLCASSPIGTTCVWDPGFACLRDAVCERQQHGGCGWTVLPGSPPCPAAK